MAFSSYSSDHVWVEWSYINVRAIKCFAVCKSESVYGTTFCGRDAEFENSGAHEHEERIKTLTFKADTHSRLQERTKEIQHHFFY